VVGFSVRPARQVRRNMRESKQARKRRVFNDRSQRIAARLIAVCEALTALARSGAEHTKALSEMERASNEIHEVLLSGMGVSLAECRAMMEMARIDAMSHARDEVQS